MNDSRQLALLPLVALTLALPASAQVSRVDLEPDATLPFRLRAERLNFDGTTVVGGTDEILTGPNVPFRWRLGTGLELVASPSTAGFVGCSDDGEVSAGIAMDPSIPFLFEAFRWTVGSPIQPIGISLTSAFAISGDGNSIVGSLEGPTTQFRPFRYSASGLFELLDTGAFSNGAATAVSEDGNVIAGAIFDQNQPLANFFQWKAPGSLVVVAATGSSINVLDMSADGRVIVGLQGMASGPTVPFVWEEGVGFIDMGPLPPNAGAARATGVSASGELVVGHYVDNASGFNVPFLWSVALGGIVRLDDHLIALGFSSAGTGRSSILMDVSGDGNALLGGDQATGAPKPWVVYLSPPASDVRSESVCGPASMNSSGGPATVEAVGSAIIGLNDTVLQAKGLPAGQTTLLIGSTLLDPMPLGNGTLCVGGPFGRFNSQVGSASASGELSVPLDLGALPTPMGTRAALAGEEWFFQAWFRDPVAPAFSNLSDAARVVFY